MGITLHAGDNRISLRRLIDQGVRVHSVVCDPPYGLTSTKKRFGKEGAAPARRENNDGSFARLSGGFMGRRWDGTGIERDPEFWRLVYEILLPGGYVFAFSGSRTGHWQACAMETAGFIMHPMHGWVYGSGFPKAHAADKAIDKMLGMKGGFRAEGGPVKRMIPGADQHRDGWIKDDGREYQPGTYVPASSEAAQWEGWAYGAQAQKPALEPIYLGQKPYSEKTGAANLLRHGVGAVNIDGCRVPSEGGKYREDEPSQDRRYTDRGATNFAAKPGPRGGAPDGRHPSNLFLDGSDTVTALFPTTKSGTGAVKRASNADRDGNRGSAYGAESRPEGSEMIAYGDAGSAARFFHQFPLADEDYALAFAAGLIDDDRGDAIIYHKKAGKKDRAGTTHPTVKPIGLLRNLIRHITPKGGVVLDPFAGSGTTAEAAKAEGFDCILMEAEPEYIDFLRSRFDLPGEIGIYSPLTEGETDAISDNEGHEPAPVTGRMAPDFDLADLLSDTERRTSENSKSQFDLTDLLA